MVRVKATAVTLNPNHPESELFFLLNRTCGDRSDPYCTLNPHGRKCVTP